MNKRKYWLKIVRIFILINKKDKMRWVKFDYNSLIWKTYNSIQIIWLWKKVWYHQWLLWKCLLCWKVRDFRSYEVLRWETRSCECINKKHKDIIWEKYWRLTIISEEPKRWWRRMVKAECECWKVITTYLQSLIDWHTKSCWCIFYDKMRAKRKYEDQLTRDMRIYTIWCDLQWRVKGRHSKKYYFDKWIKCKWKNFDEFYRDMKESYINHVAQYWEKNTTIDRIDCNWDYCKDNCRWATYKEQYLNRDCMKQP